MFDMLTRDQLTQRYTEACRDETARYAAKALYRDQHPELGALSTPAYAALTAAADDMCDLRRALSAELDRRDRDAAGCCRHCVHGPGHVHAGPCLVCPQEAPADA